MLMIVIFTDRWLSRELPEIFSATCYIFSFLDIHFFWQHGIIFDFPVSLYSASNHNDLIGGLFQGISWLPQQLTGRGEYSLTILSFIQADQSA